MVDSEKSGLSPGFRQAKHTVHFTVHLKISWETPHITATFEELVQSVNHFLKKRNAILPAEQLPVTLCFLATSEVYTSLQYWFKRTHFLLIIPRVCEASPTILASYITYPSSEEEWLEIAKHFYCGWQLPNSIGAINGKHVPILHPPGTGSDYFNNKGFFSIVVMTVVGPNAEFVFANGGVLRNTVF